MAIIRNKLLAMPSGERQPLTMSNVEWQKLLKGRGSGQVEGVFDPLFPTFVLLTLRYLIMKGITTAIIPVTSTASIKRLYLVL